MDKWRGGEVEEVVGEVPEVMSIKAVDKKHPVGKSVGCGVVGGVGYGVMWWVGCGVVWWSVM